MSSSRLRASPLNPERRVTLTFWAFTLIGGGIWLLLINFNLLEQFEPTAQYILAGVLGILGIGFFGAFLGRREKWWRLIPGWLLLTLAAMVLMSTRAAIADETAGLANGLLADGRMIAAVLFWGMAIAFLHVFLLRRAVYWWAIIPSGFMFVLGGVVAISIVVTRLETLGALLSIGMGLVFILLYAVAQAEQGWWPLIPATVLILFGIASYTTGSEVQNALLNLWPIVLIVFGAYLGKLAWSKQPSDKAEGRMEVHSVGAYGGAQTSADASLQSRRSDRETTAQEGEEAEGVLGMYTGPAPGTSVDILDDDDEDPADRDAPQSDKKP